MITIFPQKLHKTPDDHMDQIQYLWLPVLLADNVRSTWCRLYACRPLTSNGIQLVWNDWTTTEQSSHIHQLTTVWICRRDKQAEWLGQTMNTFTVRLNNCVMWIQWNLYHCPYCCPPGGGRGGTPIRLVMCMLPLEDPHFSLCQILSWSPLLSLLNI